MKKICTLIIATMFLSTPCVLLAFGGFSPFSSGATDGNDTEINRLATAIKALSTAPINGTVGATTPAAGIFTTVSAGFREVIMSTNGTIAATDDTGAVINNYGQADNALITMRACAVGKHFDVVLGTTVAKYLHLKAGAGDAVYLDGVAGSDAGRIGVASSVAGNAIHCQAFQTGVGAYDWACNTIAGAWAVP